MPYPEAISFREFAMDLISLQSVHSKCLADDGDIQLNTILICNDSRYPGSWSSHSIIAAATGCAAICLLSYHMDFDAWKSKKGLA